MVGVGLAVNLLVGLCVGRLVGLATIVGLFVGEGVPIKNEICCFNAGKSILVPLLKVPSSGVQPPFVWIPMALPVW